MSAWGDGVRAQRAGWPRPPGEAGEGWDAAGAAGPLPELPPPARGPRRRLAIDGSAGLVGWRPQIYGRGLDTLIFHVPSRAARRPEADDDGVIVGARWIGGDPEGLAGLPPGRLRRLGANKWRAEIAEGLTVESGTQAARAGDLVGRCGLRVTLGPAWLWRHGEAAVVEALAGLRPILGEEPAECECPIFRADYAVDMSPPLGVRPEDTVAEIHRRWRHLGGAGSFLADDGADGATAYRGKRAKAVQPRIYVKTARHEWPGLWRYVPGWLDQGWRWICSRCPWRGDSPWHVPGDTCPSCSHGEVIPSPVIRLEIEIPAKRLKAETLLTAERYARLWCDSPRWIAGWAPALGCASYDVQTAGGKYATWAMRTKGAPWWVWRALATGEARGLPRESRVAASDSGREAYWRAAEGRAAKRGGVGTSPGEIPEVCDEGPAAHGLCDDAAGVLAPARVFAGATNDGEALGGRCPVLQRREAAIREREAGEAARGRARARARVAAEPEPEPEPPAQGSLL